MLEVKNIRKLILIFSKKIQVSVFDLKLNMYRVSYVGGGFGPVAEQLYTVLTRLQMGLIEDKMNWTVELN